MRFNSDHRQNANSCVRRIPGGLLLVWLCVLGVDFAARTAGEAAVAEEWVRGADFQRATENWVSVTLLEGKNTLRGVCEDLAVTQQIAVLLDRRFDPSRPVDLEPPVSGALRQVLGEIAASREGTVRELGDALLLLPARQAEQLKTLAALRSRELSDPIPSTEVPRDESRLRKILERRSYSWDHFARPRELVIQACRACDLEVRNPEQIPHDLWYQGTLPRAQLIEFLTWTLWQFDLTFAWSGGTGLEVVPIPERVEIKRSHTLPARVWAEQREAWQARFPEAQWERQGARWQVTGPEDLHELLARAGRPERTPATQPRNRWSTVTYTMRVQRKPLKDVLAYLRSSGLPLEFDEQQLQDQGHDPQKMISFEVSGADVAGLLKAICGPTKIPYRIEEERILIGDQD